MRDCGMERNKQKQGCRRNKKDNEQELKIDK